MKQKNVHPAPQDIIVRMQNSKFTFARKVILALLNHLSHLHDYRH